MNWGEWMWVGTDLGMLALFGGAMIYSALVWRDFPRVPASGRRHEAVRRPDLLSRK